MNKNFRNQRSFQLQLLNLLLGKNIDLDRFLLIFKVNTKKILNPSNQMKNTLYMMNKNSLENSMNLKEKIQLKQKKVTKNNADSIDYSVEM